MQSMQRKFGKLLSKSTEDGEVGILLKEFEAADKMLAKVGINVDSFRVGGNSFIAR